MKASMTCLPILIVPNWNVEFHVHTDACDFVLGVTLGKNPNNTIDKPIYYASRLMKNAKRNYSTTKKELLAMIYAVINFDIIYLVIASPSLLTTKFCYIWQIT
jgi:hypothetical protein